jgi:putative ABC transport system substrate-binding protein
VSERHVPSATRRQFLQGVAGLGLSVLAGSALAGCAPSARAEKSYRLGMVYINGTIASKNAFLSQLRKLGYVEGENIAVEMRDAGGRMDRLPELFAEVIAWGANVIYASGTQTVIAAKAATSTLPIVGLAADPVGTGIVPSLARPGGNITGVSLFANQLAPKRVELLARVLPDVKRVGVLYNPDDPSRITELADTQQTALPYGWKVIPLPIAFKEEIPGAFADAAAAGVEALVVLLDPLSLTQGTTIVNLALEYGLPGMYGDARFATLGGLMGYSGSSLEQQAKAADYVDKILRGAKPAELAVQQPSIFDFILNQKTANALGVTFPTSVLERATDIIG